MCLAGVVGKETGSSIATFDTDGELVGIDNRSSVCVSPHRSDFIGKLVKSKQFIKAFGGTKSFNIYIGTLKWVFDDNQGIERTVHVPESFHMPEAPARLLSPQHSVGLKRPTPCLTQVTPMPPTVKTSTTGQCSAVLG